MTTEGVIAISGQNTIGLPSWGRCFWQDPNDGVLFLAYASGDFEVDFVTSADSGVTWAPPKLAFNVDRFSVHNNFDVAMDRNGEVHAGFRFENFNCYAHLTKSGQTWDTESPEQRPWSICADSGNVGGHNGSVYIHEINDFYSTSPNYVFPGFRATPQAYVVAKAAASGTLSGLDSIVAARILSPYTSAPDSGHFITDVSAVATGIPPGSDGGFPLLTAAGKPVPFGGGVFAYQKQVTYSVNTTGIVVANEASSAWNLRRVMTLFDEGDPGTTNVSTSGLRADIIQGPTMGFEKGPFPEHPLNPIIISTYKQDLGGSFDKQWEMLTTSHEHLIRNSNEIDQFTRVDSTQTYQPLLTAPRSTNFSQWAGEVFDGGIPPNVAPAVSPSSGTLCDITNGALSGVMYMYFNGRSSDGRHCVTRMLCEVEAQTQSAFANSLSNPTKTQYKFSSRFHPISGIRNFAIADAHNAGGEGGKAFWQNMRALHHVNGQWAAGKSDMVATVASGLEPKRNNLFIWDFEKSSEVTTPLKIPTFGFDYIAGSGTTNTFVGLSATSIAINPDLVVNLFDQDTSTSGTISNGDSITLEWSTPVILTRVEIPWFKTGFGTGTPFDFFEVTLETSLDGVTFDTVKTYNDAGGRVSFSENQELLVKLWSEYDGGDGDEESFIFTTRMDAMVGKFLRISFSGPQTGQRGAREIRVYGAGTTAGKTTTTFNDWNRNLTRTKYKSSRVERFDGVYEFESLPPGWRTSGDWNWLTIASGDLSRPTRLPSALPSRGGTVLSGVFGTLPVGSNGTALRTAQWIPLNSSGVVEVDISIAADELDKDGNAGRTIKWDARYHKIGIGVMVPDTSEDDGFRFYVAPVGSDPIDGSGQIKGFFLQGPCFTSTCDYFTVSTNVAPGDYTLRWVFKRGSTINNLPFTGDESVAYIDNVVGLNAPVEPSIFGYVKSDATASGSIHGFMSKTKWGVINALTKGFFHFIPRHGYLVGAPNESSNINSFLAGMNQGQIDGFLFGGEDQKSIPTGTIQSYIPVQSGAIKQIQGYLLGMKQSDIFGYTSSFESFSPASGIFSYMMVPDAAESIFGGVNLGVSGVATERIFGFVANRVFESINGFVRAPSGTTSSINSYLSPQNTESINGFIASITSLTGVINSYVLAPDAGEDIFGFLPASGEPLVGQQQRINGYLFNAGGAEKILGYINVIDTSEIQGFMHGNVLASGSINAFASGVGFASMEALGYLAGISGSASGSINSYMIAVEQPNSTILGWLIGVPIASGSLDACGNHGNVPLPSNTIPVLPTNCFNL